MKKYYCGDCGKELLKGKNDIFYPLMPPFNNYVLCDDCNKLIYGFNARDIPIE